MILNSLRYLTVWAGICEPEHQISLSLGIVFNCAVQLGIHNTPSTSILLSPLTPAMYNNKPKPASASYSNVANLTASVLEHAVKLDVLEIAALHAVPDVVLETPLC